MRGYILIDNTFITLEVTSYIQLGQSPFALCNADGAEIIKLEGNTKKLHIGQIIHTCFYRNKFQAKYNGWTGKVIHNQRQGDWIKYYSDGKIEIKGKYIDNQKYGEWIYYYLNGNVKAIGIYNCDEKEGMWEYYSPENILTKVVNYTNDIPN
jgi:hypothetical protein